MRFPRLHWSDPRPRLARAISHPQVVTFLVVAALVMVPLGVLAHHRGDRAPDRATLAAAAPAPSSYSAFTTNAQLTRGTRTGVVVSGGSLRLGATKTTRSWNRKTYEYGSWTSPWVSTRGFTQLIPSWTASTPAGSWVQVLVQVRDDRGTASGTKDLGRWSTGDRDFHRSSAGTQADAVAKVATDTLIATGRRLASYRLVVRLMRTHGGATPVLGSVGAVVSTPTSVVPTTSTPLKRTAVSLAVPRYSQMTHRGQSPQYGGGGEAWCSPTSISMVLGYYGRLPAASTYTWVPKKYADRWVNHVARLTYDYTYEGNGNWPFNAAYAATRVGNGFVTRLANLRMAERFVRAGIPLVLSIRFGRGELSGAPISSTAGHLVVLSGFTAAGNPIVNDPAAPTNTSVRRSYDRAQFERVWLRGSTGTAYVVTDAKHPLPARPKGVTSW